MKKRLLPFLLASVMALALLSGCGGSAGGNSGAPSDSAASAPSASDNSFAIGGAGKAEFDAAAPEEPSPNEEEAVEEGREVKLIRTAELELETTSFDQADSGIGVLTEELGGYMENSSVRSWGHSERWATYTVRVPAENFDRFLEKAGELCHLTWQSTGQENVSETYYDIEGRLKTQKIKLERLQDLLSKAELMEDIITIESAISETEYQIENLSGSLRHYDDLVDYATIHITLNEVYKLSNIEETPDSFASRMGGAFSSGWRSFVDSMESLAVWFAYNWMWVLILAAIVAVGVRASRKRKARFALPKLGKKDQDSQDKKEP